MSTRRVGLLGGTFDPVHSGHLQMAEAALQEFHLDIVAFIPAGHPPHKDTSAVTAFYRRVAMLQLVCNDSYNYECNPIEGSLAAPSYTIDTLRALLEYYGPGTELFFLIGVDAFIEILTWKAHQDILNLVSLIVFKRRGLSEPDVASFLTSLGYKENEKYWQGKQGKKHVYISRYIPDDVSSSAIREKIKGGQKCIELLGENVFKYIKSNRLYC